MYSLICADSPRELVFYLSELPFRFVLIQIEGHIVRLRADTDKSVRFSAAVGVVRSVSRRAMATLNYVPRRCFGALRALTYHS